MTKKKMSLVEAVKLAERVVKGKEDHVYVNPWGETAGAPHFPKCVYWDEGTDQPSCVVGHVLRKFGVPKKEIVKYNNDGVDDFDEYYDSENDPTEFLGIFQGEQDRGVPWGEALVRAKRDINWTS